MAISLQLFIAIVSMLTITITIVNSTVDGSTSSFPPSSPSPSPAQEHDSSLSLLEPILTSLGFQEIAAAAPSLSTTATATTGAANPWGGPITIFAPSDSSVLTCPSCSIPLLLHEHIVPGLFSLHYLRTLAFGTKIETLAPGRCITITSSAAAGRNNSDTANAKIFVGGVEITEPDLFNDGLVVVHGLQGFVSHLSPSSCSVERMSSLSFLPPSPVPPSLLMRLMLKDAMLRLHISGYSILALALRVKYSHLVDLRNMTVFALDDASVFSGEGQAYLSDFRFHIVPNRLLMAADLEKLPPATVLPTMEQRQKLVVTTAGGRGPLVPMRINYVKITIPDLMYNLKIAVHGVSMPFPHIHPTFSAGFGQNGRAMGNAGMSEIVPPTAAFEFAGDIEDHHGL